MAAAYARLVNPEGLASKRAETAGRIVKNMMSNPQLVAGTGRLCTELMQATAGRIVAKSGAEGVYCLGVPERGIGLAFKVEDGNARAEGPVVIEVLKRMGVLSEAELEKLKAWHHPQITNHRKDVVGEIRAGF
jgi:L-asparaginase II